MSCPSHRFTSIFHPSRNLFTTCERGCVWLRNLWFFSEVFSLKASIFLLATRLCAITSCQYLDRSRRLPIKDSIWWIDFFCSFIDRRLEALERYQIEVDCVAEIFRQLIIECEFISSNRKSTFSLSRLSSITWLIRNWRPSHAVFIRSDSPTAPLDLCFLIDHGV